jgi:hypothetical protein
MMSFRKQGVVIAAVLALCLMHGQARAETMVQALGTDFLAFEAESAHELTSNGVIAWEPAAADAEASGGQALVARGPSSLGVPGGVARYQLRFSYPGKYVLYSRWRADASIAGAEPFGANSFWYPRAFGPSPQWARSLANEHNVPESLEYDWTEDNVEYEATAEDVSSGRVFIFAVGTREEGLTLDRMVLKIGKGHAKSVLEATPASPRESSAPLVQSVLAGHDLRSVMVAFDQPITTVAATNFTAEGLEVMQVGIDLGNRRVVSLTTSAQKEGADYSLAIRGVAGASRAPNAPVTNVFRAAQVIPGWAEARLFTSTGMFSGQIVRWVDAFEYAADQHPVGGMELGGYFMPQSGGRHALFVRASSEAAITFWHASTNGFTNVVSVPASETFGEAVLLTPMLEYGKRYGLAAKMGATNGPMWLAVAARLNSTSELQPLSGAAIGALINPELVDLRVTQEPESLLRLGGQEAQFSVQADSSAGPIYFQWQRNGEDLPDATSPTLILPRVTGLDMGGYRAVIRAGGRAITSHQAYLTVSPGALRIARGAGGEAVIAWGAEAAGAVLEMADSLNPGGSWAPAAGGVRIDGPGSMTASGGATRYFRLRN